MLGDTVASEGLFENPVRFEELPDNILAAIKSSVTGISAVIVGVDKIDQDAGAGVFEGGGKCVWTTDGKRITINFGGGAGLIACSRYVDPLHKKENRE